ncbi:hypothetical protein DFH28DRAFT_1227737 [Melampsora americana]|nr:hypothetical protein DFH28DRAFT_1227737 [Melampsora americana]
MKPTDLWAGRCPRCFGPAQDEHKGSAKEPDVIICMDGNFQHQHNILTSKDDPPETQYPSIFIPLSQIAQHNITVPAVPLVKEGLEDPCSEAHKAADDTRGKSTWDKCDDTGLFAAACRHDVPLAIANIYQSGKKYLDGWGLSDGKGLERDWSFLDSLIAILRTSTCLHRLQAIELRCLALALLLLAEAQEQLSQLCKEANPYKTGRNYTPAYFQTQWEAERAANQSTAKDIKVQQQIELGKLLCLEEKMLNNSNNEAHAFDRLDQFQTMEKDIIAQRKKVGLPEGLCNLPPPAIDLFLKLWYAKTDVRTRFLALRAEQRPLDPENKVGGGSKLGQHEKEHIMTAISKRTRTMKKTLATYNTLAQSFLQQFPQHPSSPVIEYLDLLQLEADDPFWNDGVFTHSNKPWAINLKTQMGMRALARVQRGQEELCQVAWEVRRAMRWATALHENLWTILKALNDPDVDVHNVIDPILRHAILSKSLLRTKWDWKVMEVIMKTAPQVGDLELMTTWKSQLHKMNQLQVNGLGSTISGDYKNLMPQNTEEDLLERFEGLGVGDGHHPEPEEEDSLSDLNEEDWEDVIDEGMMQDLLNVEE